MLLTTIAPLFAAAYEREPKLYLDAIWQWYFSDVPRVNDVQIAYCAPWKTRLGLIRLSLDEQISFIGLNSLLQFLEIPEYVLIATIAHELVHYAHGFGSPLPKLYAYPHAGGVVERELEKRELGVHMRCSTQWIDNEWFAFYDRYRTPTGETKGARGKLKPSS